MNETLTEFDVASAPLDAGTFALIEANAGTGKTYNIQRLYTRLVTEHGFEPKQILVVTFTEAATAELRERIRKNLADEEERLTAAGAVGDAAGDAGDAAGDAAGTVSLELRRLRIALSAFDEAAIFTIHGFCNRALSRNAFEGGVPFDATFATTLDELLRDTVADFYRREAAEGSDCPTAFSELLEHARLFLRHGERLRIVAGDVPADAAAALALLRSAAGNTPPPTHKSGFKDNLAELKKKLADTETAAAGDAAAALDALEPLLGAIAGDGTAKKNAPALVAVIRNCAERKRVTAFARLREYLRDPRFGFDARKRAKNILDCDDLLHLTRDALLDAAGSPAPECPLARALRTAYKVALVDEFQDTDPVQFAIFNTVFHHPESRLLMIGDPKQAIYAFRGGDIYAYLDAAASVAPERRYSLSQNFRSAPLLIEAVNSFFAPAGVFVERELRLTPSSAGEKKRATLLFNGAVLEKPLRLVCLKPNADGSPHTKSALESRRAVPREVAGRILRMLQNPAWQMREPTEVEELRPLAPSDFAVLTVTNKEAEETQAECRALGIPAVVYKAGNVFKSSDAEALYHVLAALESPNRPALVRAALLTPLCGVSEDAMLNFGKPENAGELAVHQQRFSDLGKLWRSRGVAQALAAFVSEYNSARLAADAPDAARRLTNFRHLAELLRERAAGGSAEPAALLRWFREKINDTSAAGDAEEYEQRMESDEAAVKILTVHKSKGLQFNIVLCPFQFLKGVEVAGSADSRQWTVHDRDGKELLLPLGADRVELYGGEKMREDLAEQTRLLYVALTRAVCRCELFGGDVRRGNSKDKGIASALNYVGQLHKLGSFELGSFLEKPPRCGAISPFANSLSLLKHAELENIEPEKFGMVAGGWFASAGGGGAAAGGAGQGGLVPPPVPPAIVSEQAILSYSSLTQHGGGAGGWSSAGSADEDLEESIGSTEVVEEAEGAEAEEGENLADLSDGSGWSDFSDKKTDYLPAGRAAGLALHEILQKADYAVAGAAGADAGNREDGYSKIVEAAGVRHGLWQSNERTVRAEARRARIRELIANTLNTPLSTDSTGTAGTFCFRDLAAGDTLREWEFYFAVPHKIPLDEFRAAGLTFAPDAGSHSGFMTGILDLVFRRGERYFFADWKSDRLADYSPAALAGAMRERNYTFQAILYCVALHNWLRRSLGSAYEPERHFGGGYYIFLRGFTGTAGIHRISASTTDLDRWSQDFGCN